jgi:hypothetical protein
MDYLFMNVGNKKNLRKIEQMKQGGKKIMLVYFE